MQVFVPSTQGAFSFLPNEVLSNPTTKTYFTNRGKMGAFAPLGREYPFQVRGMYTLPPMLLPVLNFSLDALPATGSAVPLLTMTNLALLAAGGTFPYSMNGTIQIIAGAGTSTCQVVATGTILVMTGGPNDDPKVVDGGMNTVIDNTQDNAICFGVWGNTGIGRTFQSRLFQQSPPIDLSS